MRYPNEVRNMEQKMETLTLRLPSAEIKHLEVLAASEYLKKTELARKILMEGIEEEALERAKEEYAADRLSASAAAELADMPLIEFLGHLPEEKESEAEIREDLEATQKLVK